MDRKPQGRRTGGLIGLAVIALIVILTLVVQRHIRANAVLEDCLLAGHRNCSHSP